MNNSIVNVPIPINEPIKEYRNNSPEKESVLKEYKKLRNSKTDVKMWIGGKFIRVQRLLLCLLHMNINIF
tara:strand:+ start:232 stop:441 length:210 start_codon:yes stop_codon:yes gene_type:complete